MTCRARKAMSFLFVGCIATSTALAAPDDVERAFGAQTSEPAKRLSVDRNVSTAASGAEAAVRRKVLERDAERAAAAMSQPNRSVEADRKDRKTPAAAAITVRNIEARRGVEVLRQSWTLKDEVKAIVVRCPDGKERSYQYFAKTARYCTPSMTCNTAEDWVQRAVC